MTVGIKDWLPMEIVAAYALANVVLVRGAPALAVEDPGGEVGSSLLQDVDRHPAAVPVGDLVVGEAQVDDVADHRRAGVGG